MALPSSPVVGPAVDRRWRVGVAVGKFNPPHLGHAHLLTVGAARVDHLHVLLCDRPDQTLPAADRAAWLADALPDNVTVHVTPDDLPEANEPWATRALEVLPEPPDVAFTSEPWGPGWAQLMGADHVAVDNDRSTVPASGTALREDLTGNFHLLVPAARAALTRRVVCVGAESTGKTTLARGLAERLGTVWVPEHGRWYWEGRRYLADQSWDTSEFLRIARAQQALADDLARKAVGGMVVGDTDALVTAVWHRRYLGHDDDILDRLVETIRPDHYLVCAPDFAWVQDGTRESVAEREAMHADTLDRVQRSGVPFTVLTGGAAERLATAAAVCADATRGPPLT